MSSCPASLVSKRQFDATIIVTCVRGYPGSALSLNLEEFIAD